MGREWKTSLFQNYYKGILDFSSSVYRIMIFRKLLLQRLDLWSPKRKNAWDDEEYFNR